MPSAGTEEVFSNPLAPVGEAPTEESKPQKLTNADFRKLLMTPRAPSSGIKDAGAPQTGGSTQARPEPVSKPADAVEDAKASERKKKKSYYARIKKEEEEKMAELAEKYRDRAKERRDGKNPDYQAEDPNQVGMGAYRAVAPDVKSGFDAAERRKQMIQESKFLGGDMEHTHLVKGLDYALLQKVRSEIQYKEQELPAAEPPPTSTTGEKAADGTSAAVAPGTNAHGAQGNSAPVPTEGSKEVKNKAPKVVPKAPQPSSTAAEDEDSLLSFKTNMGKRIFTALFRNQPPEFNDSFIPGRLAYSIDLEEDAESDIPITVLRSKNDLMNIENTQATFTSNDLVIQKLTQILSYLRTGKASRKQKKREKGAGGKEEKGPADDSIYGEIGDYVPSVAKTDSSSRDKDRRDRDRDRGRRGDRERREHRGEKRDRDHDRERKGKSSYFSRPPQEEVRAQQVNEDESRLNSDWATAGVDSEKMLLGGKEKIKEKGKGTQRLIQGGEDDFDFYTECYPGMAYMQDAIEDSDDEADYTKMDLGNKKGPVGRWDFDTQEEYSNYMNQREAMPKAAFQYGVKMADGRKTRRIGGGKEKDRNAELNREWQQIQQILKRRKDDGGGAGKKRTRYEY